VSQTPDPSPSGQPAPRPEKRRRPVLRVVVTALCVLVAIAGAVGVAAAVVIGGYVADAPQVPSREALWALRRSPGMTFLDRNGQVIATRGAKYGQPVKLAQLPPYVPKAFLAAEDRRFYQHGPVDLFAIVRAVAANMRAKRSAQGASTLTQQLARTLFLKREQSLKRKVQEAYLAWRLEQNLSKDEVLELYLNRTYFGDGAYGLDAASETYFGKPASRLNLAEASTLAGLPNAPSRLALTNDMPGALARGHRILGIMRQEGWINDADLASASATTPVLAPAHTGEGDEGYVLDQAAAEAVQLTNAAAPDLVIRTTIDPVLQTTATNILREVVGKEGARRHATQGALVTLAPDGAILAEVGGLDHDASPFNRVVQARRQPGSSFKAFVYGAAVEHGATETEVREDAPIKYGAWNPENYGRGYAGKVTLQQALARSLNTVSVRLTLEVGPAAVADFARRLGLADIPPNPGPSIALGAYEVSPLEMAGGYQVFQTGGGRTTPYLVSEVRTTRGDVLYAHAASAPTPVLDPLFATRMVNMLKTVITAGTGTGANIGRPAAGKTGTSQDWRDAWFIGFTPDLLTAVWVGNDDSTPMAKVTGGELPAEIWRKFMTVAEKPYPVRDFPWLVAEPPSAGVIETSDQVPYADEPPRMDDDNAIDETAGDGRDSQGAPLGEDGARQARDAGDDRYDRGYERGGPYLRDEPPDTEDQPAPIGRRRAQRALPPDYQDEPPPDDAVRPRGRYAPDSPADEDPRYRY
jgi:penicillin-binding protein 1A